MDGTAARADAPDLSRRRFIALASLSAIGACVLPAGLTACSGSSGADSGSESNSSSGNPILNASEEDENSATAFVFDSVIQISGYCEQDLLDQAVERCQYFESIMSMTLEGSDVWNINHAAGAPTEVADETADLITKALPYCATSGGLFDITIGSVSSLWDFDEGVKPDDAAITEAIRHIDYTKVAVDGNTVTISDPDAKIDLGAIAKGYIADDLAAFFAEAGAESVLINLGGNVFAVGHKPDGSDWNIGIQDPNDSRGVSIATTQVADQSVVTSGLYEREFELDGVQYYHILDPKTGYPVVTDLVSTSIVSDKSIDGDAYSTILFLNGVASATQIVEATPEIEAMLVDKDGNVTMSDETVFTLL